MSEEYRRKGGRVRAERLTAEERSEIARAAAEARWANHEHSGLPKATHTGAIEIGEVAIPCAVLENGQRVLTQEGFLRAIGRARKAKAGQGVMAMKLPAFLAAKNLEPFISPDLVEAARPIRFRGVKGSRGWGYKAELLPKVCQVYLAARDRGNLAPGQAHIAEMCDLLVRGLANVGIVALVDEATGYQAERDRDELHRLLAAYLSEERLAWARRFPDEFYRQLYRLWGWHWPPSGTARSQYVGKLTNRLVYERLPPGVLEQLRRRNPALPGTGRRRWKHHQFLSEDLGQPDLRDHLLQLVAIMRVSPDRRAFEDNFERAFPGAQGRLPL
jgi:hypothetical protein